MNRRIRENEMEDRIEIRLLNPQDRPAVTRLAELDTAEAPPSPLLGGIVDGRLLAAHSLATGESIADPFRPTAEIRALLARRASQTPSGGGRRGVLDRLRKRLGGEIPARPGRASEAVR
jgi:hypothetical protein